MMLSLFVMLVALSGLIFCAFDSSATAELSATQGFGMTLSSIATPLASALRRGRGRPRKFAAPSRAVTLTLPDSVLQTLQLLDPDVSRAIVRLAKHSQSTTKRAPAELVVFGHRAVITIRPTATLQQHAGIDLVPLSDGRALISFEQPQTIAELELLLYDVLDSGKLNSEDRTVFEGIAAILKEARRSSEVTLLRRSIIVLESARKPRRASPPTPQRAKR